MRRIGILIIKIKTLIPRAAKRRRVQAIEVGGYDALGMAIDSN